MSKGSDIKARLASAILRGEGSARERLQQRRRLAQSGGGGEVTLVSVAMVIWARPRAVSMIEHSPVLS